MMTLATGTELLRQMNPVSDCYHSELDNNRPLVNDDLAEQYD